MRLTEAAAESHQGGFDEIRPSDRGGVKEQRLRVARRVEANDGVHLAPVQNGLIVRSKYLLRYTVIWASFIKDISSRENKK